jgi:K+-transporting ATPase ATPase C chain
MWIQLRAVMGVWMMLTLVTGGAYPALVSVVAWAVYPRQSAGSWLEEDGRVVGSRWIGQPFRGPAYFWGRLSATSPVPYQASASGGSNFGPLHPGLPAAAAARRDALVEHGAPASGIPIDLLTASGSGLDPHISPAAAQFQVTRVAQARGVERAWVERLVAQHTERRQLGVLGEPRVNVLMLNLALDRQQSLSLDGQ